MSNQVLNQQTTISENFQLQENSRYLPVTSEVDVMVQTTCVTAEVLEVKSPAGSLTDFSFNVRIGATNFVGNGVTFRVTLPFKITTTKDVSNVTSDNFITEYFNDYKEIALKQYGLLNCLDTLTVRLNDQQISSVNNFSAQAASIFPYFNESEVAEFFEASVADRFQKYEDYDGGIIKTFDPTSAERSMTVVNNFAATDSNIFVAGYKSGYNTRKPMIQLRTGTINDIDIPNRTLSGSITLETYLPFTIFGLNNSSTSLYGVENLGVDIKLKSNPLSYLFSTKKAADAHVYTNIVLDNSDTAIQYGTLTLRRWAPPPFIAASLKDNSGMIPPYRFGFTETVTKLAQVVEIAAGGSSMFNIPLLPSAYIPRSIYIAAIRRQIGTSEVISNTPTVFGRLSNLTVNMNGANTVLNMPAYGLHYLAKGNGLNIDKESGLYTSGFPLKLDMSQDISTNSELFVGQAHGCDLSINGSVRNLDATSAHTYDIYIVTAGDSYLQYMDGRFQTYNSLFTVNQFEMQHFAKTLLSNRMRKITMIGGAWHHDLWKNVKKGASQAWNYAKANPAEVMKIAKSMISAAGTNNISGGYGNVMGGSSQLQVSNVMGGKAVKSVSYF